MPAKHAARTFGAARILLSSGVAVLVLLVVWLAARAVGPAEAARLPTVVLPSAPLIIATSSSSAPSSAAPSSAAPSVTPSPTRVTSSPVPSRTRPSTRPPRTTSPPPPPKAKAAATLRVSGGRGEGYVAGVRVQNTGTTPLEWRVTVTHDDDDDVRLRGTWNADGAQDGDNLVFGGGTLQPGASVTFGYQAMQDGRGGVRPTGCTVVGGTCAMS